MFLILFTGVALSSFPYCSVARYPSLELGRWCILTVRSFRCMWRVWQMSCGGMSFLCSMLGARAWALRWALIHSQLGFS